MNGLNNEFKGETRAMLMTFHEALREIKEQLDRIEERVNINAQNIAEIRGQIKGASKMGYIVASVTAFIVSIVVNLASALGLRK